ncbi:amino acid/amide ABC transporter ATP-binding protein 2 (HAAT family) [Hoeflea marina]|uniref:Amino acid/amide ABC transporter ATP-binding protein 2 (HAAT family) n=1 Tax=Hoeflea marina TaxID=274592 RepID=A0A317PKH2_9HYPH|nr:ABC transporter ATP-binding protein [Hoeflea marina]PWW01462.1 amino acid/amide ABC transporter ATP-binding protein 2 (HAAT family) [Hoeflea marina]
MHDILLSISDLNVSYGKKAILRGASYDVRRGECLTLLGANGSGKSTSLNAICGFIKPTSGSVKLMGTELAGLDPHRIFAHGVAQVSQARDLFPDLTVEDNLRLGAMRRGSSTAAQSLATTYQRFPRLADRRKQPTRTLSGGEQQMVAIGRALMSDPLLLLLDEPSGGLSPQLCEEIAQIIDILKAEGVTLLMVEQNLNLAFRAADRFIVLRDGQAVDGGDVAAMAGDHEAIVRNIYL